LAPRLWPLSGSRPKPDVHDLAPSEAITHLLDDADEAELRLQSTSGGGASARPAAGEVVVAVPADVEPTPARASRDEFGDVLQELLDEHEVGAAAYARADERAHGPIPSPSRRPEPMMLPTRQAPPLATQPGDLVFVFGLRDDALTVARALSVAHPSVEVGVAGSIGRPGTRHVGTRREAVQARADGVRRGGSMIVAIGVGLAPGDVDQYAGILHEVVPDQIWIAVDVTRKPEDTRAWAYTVAEAGSGIDAIAAIGVAYTTTPDSTSFLGIPVGWADGVS
jgi:hypothetical protein